MSEEGTLMNKDDALGFMSAVIGYFDGRASKGDDEDEISADAHNSEMATKVRELIELRVPDEVPECEFCDPCPRKVGLDEAGELLDQADREIELRARLEGFANGHKWAEIEIGRQRAHMQLNLEKAIEAERAKTGKARIAGYNKGWDDAKASDAHTRQSALDAAWRRGFKQARAVLDDRINNFPSGD